MVKGAKRNKKAQMKIQQMTFMLVAVVLFFALVGLAFLSIRIYNIKKMASSLEEENAMLLVSKLADSPEFSCGNSFEGSRISCIDEDKIMALKQRIGKYSDFWGVVKIEIRRVYPNEGVIEIFSKSGVKTLPDVSNFVALCRKEESEAGAYNKCELAKLIISSEDKG